MTLIRWRPTWHSPENWSDGAKARGPPQSDTLISAACNECNPLTCLITTMVIAANPQAPVVVRGARHKEEGSLSGPRLIGPLKLPSVVAEVTDEAIKCPDGPFNGGLLVDSSPLCPTVDRFPLHQDASPLPTRRRRHRRGTL